MEFRGGGFGVVEGVAKLEELSKDVDGKFIGGLEGNGKFGVGGFKVGVVTLSEFVTLVFTFGVEFLGEGAVELAKFFIFSIFGEL